MNRFLVLLSLFAFSILLGGCVSLAADVTPPPGFQPTQAAQPVAVETVYPLVLPDPVNGEAIYADKCAACHGETGMSDGPMAEQLPQPAPELGNPEVARAARPVDWFMIFTQGNLENLMPNFDGSLSERE
ncbi:MAG TPA: cytochrome c, partial [Anaerolineaceae bacterium]|nr:cytochrome c [Anaerolineaceae bacterium]